MVNARARSLFRNFLPGLGPSASKITIVFQLFEIKIFTNRVWFYDIAGPSLACCDSYIRLSWRWAGEKPQGSLRLWAKREGRREEAGVRNKPWLFDMHIGISKQAIRPGIQAERKCVSDETPTLWSFSECNSFWQKLFLLHTHYRN